MRGVLAGLIIILMISVIPATSFADGGKTYVEIKGGQFKPTGDLADRRFHNSSNIELSVGHRFFKYFSAEVSYGHYKVEGDIEPYVIVDPVFGNFFFEGHDKLDVYPLLLTAKFMYPVEDGFIYAGGGYGRYKVVFFAERQVDSSLGFFEDSFRGNDTVNGFHYMLGTMYDVTDSWTIGLEYKEVKTEEAEFEDSLFGVPTDYKTDVNGRMISGFVQVRF